ncbi:MAG: hypothetical protein ACTHU0_31265 [Kofleriaceae bacterium]
MVERARGPLTLAALDQLATVAALKRVAPPPDADTAAGLSARFVPNKRYAEHQLEIRGGARGRTLLPIPVWCVGSCHRDEDWKKWGATVLATAKAGDRTLYVVRMRRVCNGGNDRDLWIDRVIAAPGGEPRPPRVDRGHRPARARRLATVTAAVTAPSSSFVHVTEICPRRGEGQDRVTVVSSPDRLVIALADGAGGAAGGERAATAVIDAVMTSNTDDWQMVLTELELDPDRLGPGLTTAVALTVTGDGISGASAGDSGAWVVWSRGDEPAIDELTANQQGALIGNHAVAVAFRGGPLAGGTLVVASDGLFRYAPREAIARAALGPDLTAAAHALVALVRLPSGELPDDVSIVLCREAPPR